MTIDMKQNDTLQDCAVTHSIHWRDMGFAYRLRCIKDYLDALDVVLSINSRGAILPIVLNIDLRGLDEKMVNMRLYQEIATIEYIAHHKLSAYVQLNLQCDTYTPNV